MAIALLLILGGGAYLAVRHFGPPSELDLAEKAIERRDFKAAREHIEKHRAANPNDWDALLLAARTARRNDDLPAAAKLLGEYKRAVGVSDAARFESELLAIQLGDSNVASKRLASCRENLDDSDAALGLEAIIVATLNTLAAPYSVHDPLNQEQEKLPAVRDARAAIDLWFQRGPSSADRVQGLVWRARLREIAGGHVGAIADLDNALSLEPDHLHARFLAGLFRRQEAPDETRRQLEALTTRFPDELQIAFAYAIVLRDQGRLTESTNVLDRLIERSPTNAGPILLRASVSMDLGNASEAEPILRKALASAPNQPDILVAMGRCLRHLGKFEEASQYQEAFLKAERERQEPKK